MWIYAKGKLKINLLIQESYQESPISPTFLNIAVVDLIPQCVERAKIVGMSQSLEEFEESIVGD
ncbi:MAG: hypothetical protein MUC48_09805 [Leptolyngbya sp. Prado105]|jgi:hypothetical protein|nr:hypothetical protein [Leptolyngbya sp. Prado105]